MKQLGMLVGVVLVAGTAAAGEFTWKSYNSTASGSFTNANHWSLSGTSATQFPFAPNDRAYIGYNYPYLDVTVTMPQGVYTNYARFNPTLCHLYGKYKTLTIDGTGTTLIQPQNDTGTSYGQYPFVIGAYNQLAYSLVEFDLSSLAKTAPNFEFTDFKFHGRHLSDGEVVLEFDQGTYNFYNPGGVARTDSKRPFLRFFDLGHNFSNHKNLTAPLISKAEIVFKDDTALSAGVMGINATATTNLLRFVGGEHTVQYLYAPLKMDGQAYNTTFEAAADLIVESNATFTVATKLSFDDDARTNQHFRLIARDGGTLNLNGTIAQTKSDAAIIVEDGGTLNIADTVAVSNLTVAAGGKMNASKWLQVEGTMNISGTLDLDKGSPSRLYAGELAGGYGIVNFYDGVITNSNVDGYTLNIGGSGTGEFHMYGGVAYFGQVRVGYTHSGGYNYDATNIFHLAGGTCHVRCSGGAGNNLIVANDSLRTGKVILDGGVLVARIANCGAGTGLLEANGGTFRSTASWSNMINGFKSAKIGPKGLTLQAATGNCGTSQAFSDLTSEPGKLILEGGSYTLTLGGDQSELSIVEVKTGTAVLNATGLNRVVVDDGATLKLTTGTPLAVDEFVFGDTAIIAMSTAMTAGTDYVLVSATQPISAATQAALTAALAAGRIGGVPTHCFPELVFDGGTVTLKLPAAAGEVTMSVPASTTSNATEQVVAAKISASVLNSSALIMGGSYRVEELLKTGWGKLSIPDTTKFRPDVLKMKAGVLEVTGPATGAQIDATFQLVQETTNDLVIVKNDVPLTMKCPTGGLSTGEFVKRGASPLTLEVAGTQNLTGGAGYSRCGNGCHWQWNEINVGQLTFDTVSEMVTTSGVPPFLVAEGELTFHGAADGAKVVCAGSPAVGTSTKVGTAQPGLVLDHVAFESNTYPNYYFHLGIGIECSASDASKRTGDVMYAPYMVLTNGASFLCGQFEISRFSYHKKMNPRLIVDNSTFRARNGFTIGPGAELIFRNDAQLISPKFAKGGQLYIKYPATVLFDNASWTPENTAADFTLGTDDAAKFAFTVANAGLKLAVPASRTWTVDMVLNGTGGLVKSGAGTLVLPAEKVNYTGVTRVTEGTLKSAEVGTLELGLDWNGTTLATVPTVEDVTSNICHVDFGRTDANPIDPASIQNLVVANLTGTTYIGRPRLTGTGLEQVRGIFEISNNQLILKSIQAAPGAMIIIE